MGPRAGPRAPVIPRDIEWAPGPGPWAPVMPWGIEWAPGPGPWAPVMLWVIEWAPGPGPGPPTRWYFVTQWFEGVCVANYRHPAPRRGEPWAASAGLTSFRLAKTGSAGIPGGHESLKKI